MAQSGGRANRHGDILRLQTSPQIVELKDVDCDADDALPSSACRKYEFLAYLKRQAAFVVSRSLYEDGDYVWIDANTGAATELKGYPHISPDGSRFVTVSGDDEYETNSVEVWKLDAAGPRREWGYDPPDHAHLPATISYCFVRWLDPNRAALRAQVWFGDGRGEPTDRIGGFDAMLALRASQWSVTRTER